METVEVVVRIPKARYEILVENNDRLKKGQVAFELNMYEEAIINGTVLPNEDAVSRKAVINTLDNMDKALDTDRTVENYKMLLTECYKVLPPLLN